MMNIKQNECFQSIDTILHKIELLENKATLILNSEISHTFLNSQNRIKNIELELDYIEKNIECYKYTNCIKVIS